MAKLERFFEAELFFKKALSIEPSNLDSIVGNIKCQIKLNNYDAALEHCKAPLEINPNNKELLRLKQLLIRESVEIASGQNEETIKIERESTFEVVPTSQMFPTAEGTVFAKTSEPRETTLGDILASDAEPASAQRDLTVSFTNTLIGIQNHISDDNLT